MGESSTNCTVLLIDDEQAGLYLRKLVLENRGFTVLSSTTAESGMELFRRNDVDIVVTDHLLGRSTAASVAATMKRLKPHVPIISLSGTTNIDDALRYADYFIGKGEGPDILISTLDQILQQKRQERETIPSVHPDLTPRIPNARALLAAIIEDSSDAILSKTLDGIVTSWNHSAEVMYGYTSREMVGQSISLLLPSDRPDEVKHILNRLKRGERISHYETLRIAKDGHQLNVALTISPIRDEQGNLVGASTIARDISEQKNAEEALRKAESLALAGRMAATVAHEINNPLESIGNVLYLLQNSVQLNDDARRYVDIAQEELKRVSEITRLTLGMHRGGVNRNESVQISNLIDNVLTLYQRKATTLGITMERRYRVEASVLGSRSELRQVLSNLIVNAMDALASSGDRLIIMVRKGHRWDTGQSGVRVNIVDNGPGIPNNHRSQLFQAFYTTKGEQGTGIGLWVSKGIIKKHGGELRVHSSTIPGKSGTCFSLFIPFEGNELAGESSV